jgi:hypothetical protein
MKTAHLTVSSASDALERPAQESYTSSGQKKSQPEDISDPAPVSAYTETKAQFGYSSVGCNNATISISQVSFLVSSMLDQSSGADR